MNFLIPTKRRVMFEKTRPSYMNVEYMLENILNSCEVHKSISSEVFFYVLDKKVVLEVQLYNNNKRNVAILNPDALYYNIKTEPYSYKINLRKVIKEFFYLDSYDDGTVSVDKPSNYNHVLDFAKLI